MKKIIYIVGAIISMALLLSTIIVLIKDPTWICRIHDTTRYSWWQGLWHAFWITPHLIRNLFTDTNCISHHGSEMYYVCFWLTLIIGLLARFITRTTSDANHNPTIPSQREDNIHGGEEALQDEEHEVLEREV